MKKIRWNTYTGRSGFSGYQEDEAEVIHNDGQEIGLIWNDKNAALVAEAPEMREVLSSILDGDLLVDSEYGRHLTAQIEHILKRIDSVK